MRENGSMTPEYSFSHAPTAQLLVDSYHGLVLPLFGDMGRNCSQPSSPQVPTKNSIVFLNNAADLDKVISSEATIVIVPVKNAEKIKADFSEKIKNKTFLQSPNVKLAMAKINQKFFQHEFLAKIDDHAGVHAKAIVALSAKLGKNVSVGPGAVISENCVIGDNTRIGANTVVEPYTSIGNNCVIWPLVYIGHSCKIGHGVYIQSQTAIGSDGFGYATDDKNNHHKVPHYGAVVLEDDVHIGAGVNIDRGTFEPTIIRTGTKMDNHIHIAHNNDIGKNCLITAGFISAGSTTIGDNCVFAGRSSVNGHIDIGKNNIFGPLSVVVGDMPDNSGVFGGFPAVPINEFKRYSVVLRHLPKMRKQISEIFKHLGLKE
jgi:UDP-3-O-[3-hydroxymyristoyl] glucosamine N-acyltransferase